MVRQRCYHSPPMAPTLDHPTLPLVKERFADVKFMATEFRGQTTLVVPAERLHDVARFLRDDPRCDCNFLPATRSLRGAVDAAQPRA
jgi:hypothetical protein